MKDIEANLRLSGDNNAALWIHSQAESDEMEEVHAELNQIDLGVISNAFSYIPPMEGILNADSSTLLPTRPHGRGGYEH